MGTIPPQAGGAEFSKLKIDLIRIGSDFVFETVRFRSPPDLGRVFVELVFFCKDEVGKAQEIAAGSVRCLSLDMTEGQS